VIIGTFLGSFEYIYGS